MSRTPPVGSLSPYPQGDGRKPSVDARSPSPAVEKTKTVSGSFLAQAARFFVAAFFWVVTFKWVAHLFKREDQEEIPAAVTQGIKAIRKGELDKRFSAQGFIDRNFNEGFGELTESKPIKNLENEYKNIARLGELEHRIKELSDSKVKTKEEIQTLDALKKYRDDLLKEPALKAEQEKFKSLEEAKELFEIFPGPATGDHLKAPPVIQQLKKDIEESRLDVYMVIGTKENGEKIYKKITSVVGLGKLVKKTFSGLSMEEQIKRMALFQQSFIFDETKDLYIHFGIKKMEVEKNGMNLSYQVTQNTKERSLLIFDSETQELTFSYSHFVKEAKVDESDNKRLSDLIRTKTVLDLKNPKSATSVQSFTIESDSTEKVKKTAEYHLRLPKKDLSQKLQEAFFAGKETTVSDKVNSSRLISKNFQSIIIPSKSRERIQRIFSTSSKEPPKSPEDLVRHRISSDIERERIYSRKEKIESFERLEEIIGKENQEILALFHQGFFFEGMNALQDALGKYVVFENRNEDSPTFKIFHSDIVGEFSYCVHESENLCPGRRLATVRYKIIIDLENPENSSHTFTFESFKED